MNAFIGEIAARITSLCFAATATFFTPTDRQVGAVVADGLVPGMIYCSGHG